MPSRKFTVPSSRIGPFSHTTRSHCWGIVLVKGMGMSEVYIGTSGWSYKGWEKAFYPHDLPKTQQFQFYATQFPTVEINLTFYRLPTPNMVRGWRDKAPPGFVYAIKGSRYITHMKKLQNLHQAVD